MKETKKRIPNLPAPHYDTINLLGVEWKIYFYRWDDFDKSNQCSESTDASVSNGCTVFPTKSIFIRNRFMHSDNPDEYFLDIDPTYAPRVLFHELGHVIEYMIHAPYGGGNELTATAFEYALFYQKELQAAVDNIKRKALEYLQDVRTEQKVIKEKKEAKTKAKTKSKSK